jgi:hypothetical protein
MATFRDYHPLNRGHGRTDGADINHPHEKTNSQVLCASTEELREAIRSGVGLPNTPCIYIPREDSAVLPTADDFIEEL